MINQSSSESVPEFIPPLRKHMTTLVRSLRRSILTLDTNFSKPLSNLSDEILVEGKKLRRKRIVLLTSGCTVASCTMCPLPNEAVDAKMGCITPSNLMDQFDHAFSTTEDEIDGFDVVTIYTNGNFFVDQEVPPLVREYIYEQINKSAVSLLIVESLPQFVTKAIIDEAKAHLGEKQLSVYIGLQSSDDLIRTLAINSTTTRVAFEQAVHLLHEAQYLCTAFLMVKPPFLTETEAIRDAVQSIVYLSTLGVYDPMLCATKISPHTVVSLLAKEGNFVSPWLWSVIEILKEVQTHSPASKPIIATSLFDEERNADSTCTQNCEQCSPGIIDLLTTYNKTRDPRPLFEVRCSCYEAYRHAKEEEEERFGSIPVLNRITAFLDRHPVHNAQSSEIYA